MKKIIYSLFLLLSISFNCISTYGSELPYYPSAYCTRIICIDGYQFVVFIDPITGLIDDDSGLTQFFRQGNYHGTPIGYPARCTSEKPETTEKNFWELEDEMD